MQKKAEAGKKTAASRVGSKNASKNASAAASDDESPELDAHGNPIQSDEPATGADKAESVKRLADQVDKFGVSCSLLCEY